VDPSIPVEKVMETLKVLVGEGKFDYIGLSECSAATLQRAAKVATITAVEIEISPMSYEEETKKGENTHFQLTVRPS
jgi:pyridoxine 4-dehydrogenase